MFNWFKKGSQQNGPNFSHLDSYEKAQAAASSGQLVTVFLFPIEYGGPQERQNVVFVPAFVAELKARYDEMVGDLLKKGKVNRYSAKPEYKGKSVVPSAITITASGDAEFAQKIHIW